MQLYRSRYDGTDDVAVYIREILQFAEAQNHSVSIKPLEGMTDCINRGRELRGDTILTTRSVGIESKSPQETRGWAEMFIRQPRFYLRLSLTLDYALARGRYPQDSDLPILVRDLPVTDMPRSSFLDATVRVQEVPNSSAKEDLVQHQSIDQFLTTVTAADDPSSPSASSTYSKSDTSMAFDHKYLPVSVNPLPAAANDPDPAAAAAATSQTTSFPDSNQERRPSITHSPSPRETSSPPAYQSMQDVNLDFFDLGCTQNVSEMQLGEEVSTVNDMDWANSMLDEILNAIPA